jgi:hypothetical protein
MRNIILVVGLIFAFFVGLFSSSCIIQWWVIKPGFFSVRLIEILQLVIGVVIAIFVAYYLSTRTHNEQRQKQIKADFLDGVSNLAREIYSDALEYMDNPCLSKSRALLLRFDELVVRLSFFDDKKELGDGINKDKIKLAFFEFKESVTGGQFYGKKAVFTSENKRLCVNKHTSFSTELLIAKFGLYNK